jgi:putative transposase
MPWLETAPVDERERFIAVYRLDLYCMAELCARYNVSRKTGYKWLDRMEAGGRAARSEPRAAPLFAPHCG